MKDKLDLKKHIRNVDDFPIPGIKFRDITSLIEAPEPFRKTCKELTKITQKFSCNTHPHNSHIEILVSTGIIGYLLLLILFLKFTYSLFIKNYYSYKKNDQLLLNLFFTLFFIEVFPFRTTGSFFSTANATYFFIIISIVISLAITRVKNK